MDIQDTIGVLELLVSHLTHEDAIRRGHGGGVPESQLLIAARHELHRLTDLRERCAPGERERFIEHHPKVYDQLDGIYDCGGPDCPSVGFKDGEDRQLHHRMWFDSLSIR